jgi:glycosyltransferase involved in cell wall biosynthesis
MTDNIFNKVLFIGPKNDFGGMGTVLETYSQNIQQFKFVATYPENKKSSRIIFFGKSLFKIIRYIIYDKDIEILHLHSASKGSFARKSIICLLGKVSGKKIVFHIHSGNFHRFYHKAGIFKYCIRFVLRLSDGVVCLSQQWSHFFKNTMKLNNVFIVGNPVEIDTEIMQKDEITRLQLLFLGKICDSKGIFGLIKFLKTNKYFLNNQIKLTIGGTGEDERLAKILEEPVFKNRIEYKGWIKGKNKKNEIRECDIFVLPSYIEALPVSILEAMAHAKPVIATNVGGIPAIVKENYNGWLMNPGEFDRMDYILDQIFLNKKNLKRYSNNSLIEASKFSTQAILKELSDVYNSLLQSPKNISVNTMLLTTSEM